MPCDDITETIRLRFDGADRLTSYTLSKKTCGGGVGTAALLGDFFQGRSMEEMLALTPEAFLADRSPGAAGGTGGADGIDGNAVDAEGGDAGLEAFLEWKHYFAMQIALEVLTGRAPGGIRDRCVVAGVTYDGDELYFEADIPIDLPTERIQSCGLCKGCGSKKAANRATAQET